jgi:hypothetical protein
VLMGLADNPGAVQKALDFRTFSGAGRRSHFCVVIPLSVRPKRRAH